MSQYKATDDSIFALGADSRPIIVSKVPKHGFDEIRVSRVSKDGKLVLKDKTGTALAPAHTHSHVVTHKAVVAHTGTLANNYTGACTLYIAC